jgi:hypothetical protein
MVEEMQEHTTTMQEQFTRKQICRKATLVSAANRHARKDAVRQFCDQARKTNPAIAALSRREFERFVKSASRLAEPSVSQAVEEVLQVAFGELTWMRLIHTGPVQHGTTAFIGAAQRALREASAS